MKRETRPKVGGLNFRPAKDYAAHGVVARGFGLVFSSQVRVRIAGCGIIGS